MLNCSFIHVAEPERGEVIRLVETGEANLRAVVIEPDSAS